MQPILKKLPVVFFFFLTAFSSGATTLDSLQQLLQHHRQLSNHNREIRVLIQIGKVYLEQDDHQSALSFFDQACKKAMKEEAWNLYQKASGEKAQAYLALNQFPDAIKTLSQAIDFLKTNKGENLGETYSKLAEAYRRIGNNELAYEYHLSGLHIYTENKDTVNIARSLYNIGSIFFYQDNYETALEYYQKTLDICTAAKLERHIFSCLSALGSTYNRIRQTEKSLEYNRRAYELGKRLKLKAGLAYAIMNLGANYAAIDQTDKALELYREALDINRQTNDAWGECGTLRIIGEALMKKREYDKSIEHLTAAKELAEKKGFRPRLLEINRTLASYYEMTANYKLMAKYLEKYAILKDTLANEATLQKMSESKTRYEILQKEKELALKDAEFITQQRTFLLVGMGILSIFIWLLYRQNRLRKKTNLLLAEKNKEIEKQNEELASAYTLQKETNKKIKEQNRQLEQSNIELKRFAFITSHDLKEPLRSIGSYANLLQRRYKDQLDNDANEFLEYITSSTKRLYSLLNDVLNYSKLDFNKNEKKLTDVREALEIANENLRNKIKTKNAIISIGQLPKITADKLHLVQLFQNLIDNSLKYSEKEKPEVKIESKEKDGYYEFSVKDNGIGIDPDYQQKIFEMFKRLHTRDKYEGSGIGLAICKKIVQEYGGDIWVESSAGRGSTFYFTFPVPK
ncbi:MAG TPA: tetratricopeptide repeat protein [Bacteroidetes bacterium]|nr:tetratricopeptide repeat protein [Bacteroidota bacterium]